MRRPRRTPTSTPESGGEQVPQLLPSFRTSSNDSGSLLPETVQQAAHRSSSVNNNSPSMARRRKRKSSSSSSSVIGSLRRWLFQTSPSSRDPLLRGPAHHHHSTNNLPNACCKLSVLVVCCLYCVYSISKGPALLPSLSYYSSSNKKQPQFVSFSGGPVSQLASQPFDVRFHYHSAKFGPFHRPRPLKMLQELTAVTQRDFGGLDIRFLEDEGLRQQRRVIYHEFQSEWGVEQLKSGPNDGACVVSLFLCVCAFTRMMLLEDGVTREYDCFFLEFVCVY